MTRIQKNKLIKLSFTIGSLVLGFFLFFPASVHAEAIYKVLASTDASSIGGKIQIIWKQLLNVVNSIVVIILIVVAFAEMLQININTYGVKKILPTLILAIIAANFSFMFCRVIIDISNVSINFVACISNPPTVGSTCIGSTRPMLNGTAGKIITVPPFPKWTIFSDALPNLFLDLLLLVEAIILLCLAFLFIVRNWVIYALVIFSPVAFMAMVLPSTKKYFTQWWTFLIQWSFMPLISFTFIALANTFTGMIGTGFVIPGIDSLIIPSVFVSVCLYYAITMPFKLGGPVMQNFYKMTGAKHLAGKTKEFGVTKAQGLGLRAWNSWQQAGLDAQRGQNALGRLKIGNWKVGEALGKRWIGNALIKAKANLEHEDARSKGLVEGIKARHYYSQGDKLQLEREYTKNREGEIKEYEAYALGDIQKRGAINPKDEAYSQIVAWREGSGKARAEMAVAASMEAAMIQQGQYMWMSGGGDRTDAETKEEHEDRRQEYFRRVGVTKQEWETYNELLQMARVEEERSKAGMNKMLADAAVKPAHHIVQIDQAQFVSDLFREIEETITGMHTRDQELVDLLRRTGRSVGQLDDTERSAYADVLTDATVDADGRTREQRITTVIEKNTRLKNVLAAQNIIKVGDRISRSNSADIGRKIESNRQDIIDGLNKKAFSAGGSGHVPAYLRNYVDTGPDGHVTGLRQATRIDRTRMQGQSQTKTNSRASDDYMKRSIEEVASIWYGSDDKDGLTEDIMARARNGQVVTDSNKASRIAAVAMALKAKLMGGSPEAARAVAEIINREDPARIRGALDEWITIETERQRDTEGTDAQKAAFIALRDDPTRAHAITYYSLFVQPSHGSHLREILARRCLPGEPT